MTTTEPGGMEAGRDALCADVRDLFDRAIEEDGRMCDAQVPLDNLCGAVVGRILQTFAALATARSDESLKWLRKLSEAATPGRLRSQGYSHDEDHCVPLIAERLDVPPGGTPTNGMVAMATLFPSEMPADGKEAEYRRAEADADFIVACWNHVRAALATASQTAGAPVITEDMIEAACRAAVKAMRPNADADLQVPRLNGGGTHALWESVRFVTEPALKAALDRAAAPQSEDARNDD